MEIIMPTVAYFICSYCNRGQNYEGPVTLTLVNCRYCKKPATIPENNFKYIECVRCEDKSIELLKAEIERFKQIIESRNQEIARLNLQLRQFTVKTEEVKTEEVKSVEEIKEIGRFSFLEVDK